MIGNNNKKRQFRYNNKKYILGMDDTKWELFYFFSKMFGETSQKFYERLVYIQEVNSCNSFLKEDLSKVDILNELSMIYNSEISLDDPLPFNALPSKLNLEKYKIMNGTLIDKKKNIKTNADFVKLFLPPDFNFAGKERKISLNLRSTYYDTPENDPLIWYRNLCRDKKINFVEYIKSIYWDSLIIMGIVDLEIINQLESGQVNYALYEKIAVNFFENQIFSEFGISPNTFYQVALFKRKKFNFQFLAPKKQEDKFNGKHIINFSLSGESGGLIFLTLSLLANKFNRSLSEMLKLIIFLFLRREKIINNRFEIPKPITNYLRFEE